MEEWSPSPASVLFCLWGERAPGRTRTPNRQIRSLVLYPIELRVPEGRTKIRHLKEMQAPHLQNTCCSLGMEAITAT